MITPKYPLILIVGPTAVGKTKMALELADLFPALEVISADSRQIFRFMDIGTAKPEPDELAKVRHYFIDIKNPDETFNAGDFGQQGRECFQELRRQNKIPVVVGGSGLYIRSLVDGLFQGEVSDPEIKTRLQNRADEEGLDLLYGELTSVDPESAAKIHPNDCQRVVRALEVWHIAGKPISLLRKQLNPEPFFNPIFAGLTRAREILYQMINARVDAMIEQGLFDEVRELRKRGYHRNLQSQRTVGYGEAHDFLDEKIVKDEAVALIKRNTRRFAKRQLTWFNRDERVNWFSIDETAGWQIAKKFLVEALKRYF